MEVYKIALKLLKAVYYKFLRPKIEAYVNSTENQWDNKALEFFDEIIELIFLRLVDVNYVKKEMKVAMDKIADEAIA